MTVNADWACTMALAASSVTTRAASSARSPTPQAFTVATAKWRAAAGASREKANARAVPDLPLRGLRPVFGPEPTISPCRRHTSAKASISRVTESAR